MAIQHLRSSTANKRPLPASMSDGQVAINTNTASPGIFFKDSAGALIKVGPTHVGTTAPNASPASGGATGNTVGEQWLDTTGSTYVLKIWDGSAWRSESGTFVDVNGDTMTGTLVMDNQQQVRFRETTANGTNYIAIQAPASVAADRTLTLPDVSGTIVSTGDTGTVTSTMIADGTIVNADVNASAAIVGTKISPDFGSQNVTTTGTSTAASFIPTSSTAPTNGLYLPSANSVALSTNGTGRLFVDADGNVAIGSSTFTGWAQRQVVLDAGAGASASYVLVNDTTGRTATDGGLLTLSGSDLFLINRESANLSFRTGNVERLRFTSSGDLVFKGAGTAGVTSAASFSGSAPVNSLVLDSSGRLGIGTSTVSTILNIRSNTSDDGILLEKNDGTDVARLFFDGTSSDARLDMFSGGAAKIQLRTNGDSHFSGGRLGIGTTSPSRLLTVYDAGTLTYLQLAHSGASGTSRGLELVLNSSDAEIINRENGQLIFRTNNIPRASIDSSGRLLVGTASTSSVNRLIVQSSSDAPTGAGTLFIARGDNAPLTTNVLGALRFGGSTHVNSAEISAFRDGGTWTAGSSLPTGLTFSTTSDASASPTERFRITSAGVLQVADAGNIAVGTTTGTKIGTATTQKLGFFNATPVVQPAAVADATDAATVITQLNDLLAKLRTLGIIAT